MLVMTIIIDIGVMTELFVLLVMIVFIKWYLLFSIIDILMTGQWPHWLLLVLLAIGILFIIDSIILLKSSSSIGKCESIVVYCYVIIIDIRDYIRGKQWWEAYCVVNRLLAVWWQYYVLTGIRIVNDDYWLFRYDCLLLTVMAWRDDGNIG